MTTAPTEQKIDFRLYIGILFFRWQIIAVCFLYCLLGGVLYLQFVPREYLTSCKIMIYRDPKLQISSDQSPWRFLSTHSYLLQSDKLRKRAAEYLLDEWGERMGSRRRMMLNVNVKQARKLGSTLDVDVRAPFAAYGEAFLSKLMEEHQAEWGSIQRQASVTASTMLSKELNRLEEQIRSAEEDQIDYQRLHDIARVEARASMESRYLQALMERRSQLTTELMLLEAQVPDLSGANASVISDVTRLTLQTGALKPIALSKTKGTEGSVEEEDVRLPTVFANEKNAALAPDNSRNWHDMGVKLARLRQKEKELLANLKPEHPQVRAVRKDIENIRNELNLAAQIEMGRLKNRYKALTTHIKALEAAEYQWQNKNLLASLRKAELKRKAAVVSRFESNYSTLYGRLHEMRISEELQAEHFRFVESVATKPDPVWPDPLKIFIITIVLGLGSGLGITLTAQILDNKIQSIQDVEVELGIPFIGGVPFWVHSDLEQGIRPIVTEEHSTGAIEAYRALRTSVLSSMNKMNEKILVITSADSREGKTLTALNIAIMMAQMNKKVLLADMDLRRGRLHRSLGIEREPGITDALKDNRPLKEIIKPTNIENLHIAPTGSSIKDTAELLQSADIAGAFADLQDDYDYIIMDTSPVLRVTDTVIIVSQGFGAVLYVARVNQTPKPLIRYSLDMLKDARILGMVMNSIEMNKISSLYYTYQYPNYAYYSNAYAYGYDYYYDDRTGAEKQRKHRRRSGEKNRHKLGKWLRRTFLPLE